MTVIVKQIVEMTLVMQLHADGIRLQRWTVNCWKIYRGWFYPAVCTTVSILITVYWYNHFQIHSSSLWPPVLIWFYSCLHEGPARVLNPERVCVGHRCIYVCFMLFMISSFFVSLCLSPIDGFIAWPEVNLRCVFVDWSGLWRIL